MSNRSCANAGALGVPLLRRARGCRAGVVPQLAKALLPLLLAARLPAQAADQIDYVVQAGDNPWNLTERFLKGLAYWPRLQTLNHIHDSTHLAPGTVLHIPVDWLQLTTTRIEVTGVYGEVNLFDDAHESAGASAARIQTGASLAAGGRLVTAAGATVTLLFADQSQVLLLPDSELRIQRADRLAAGGGVMLRLQLLRGNLENHVQPRKAPGTRFEIETPAAVAAVRGTDFRVSADPGRTRTEVLGGTVRFGNRRGDLDLRAGFGTAAAAGAAPLPPQALLPAPDASAAPTLVERLPLDAPIAAVDGAGSYRSQFASDAAFTVVLSNETSRTARLRAADLPDGHLYYRVRAIAADGLEGYAAAGELAVHARPEPPLLVSPPGGEVVAEARPELKWTARSETARYRIQVAAERSFAAPLVDLETDATGRARPDHDLPVGDWWWRVATRTEALGLGPFSDALQLRRALPGPELPPPRLHDGELEFAWSDAGPGMRYHLQLAADPGFATPQVVTELDQPHFVWHPPKPGHYWLRVATEASGDLVGPWGPSQAVEVPEPPARWPWLLLLLPLLMAP